jgi:hypothetical protein
MNILAKKSLPPGLRFVFVILLFTASLHMLWFQEADAQDGQEYFIQGSLCSYSGGSSISSTKRLTFDGRGNFWFGSEYSYEGELSDQKGRFVGGGSTPPSANPTGRYSVRGDFVILHDDTGNHPFRIHMRQVNGRITEIIGANNQTLYAVGLCD